MSGRFGYDHFHNMTIDPRPINVYHAAHIAKCAWENTTNRVEKSIIQEWLVSRGFDVDLKRFGRNAWRAYCQRHPERLPLYEVGVSYVRFRNNHPQALDLDPPSFVTAVRWDRDSESWCYQLHGDQSDWIEQDDLKNYLSSHDSSAESDSDDMFYEDPEFVARVQQAADAAMEEAGRECMEELEEQRLRARAQQAADAAMEEAGRQAVEELEEQRLKAEADAKEHLQVSETVEDVEMKENSPPSQQPAQEDPTSSQAKRKFERTPHSPNDADDERAS
ncbi:MAG: hypothetical protein M1828_004787 [Chrysothrix sp. TS-e1954]|nr:MAG: hypothetical protein M1828_004787 [Chrysothrix sp. TS-e1954]